MFGDWGSSFQVAQGIGSIIPGFQHLPTWPFYLVMVSSMRAIDNPVDIYLFKLVAFKTVWNMFKINSKDTSDNKDHSKNNDFALVSV